MEAWKQGCKGLTVYVDECRTGVLVSTDKKDTEFKQHDAPKRPKELEAEFHQIKVKGTNYGIFIGLLNSKPYEVFAFSEPNTDKKFIKGIIRKSGKGEYEFNSDTYHVINLISLNGTAEERTFTLMLSGLLRHGAHPKFIIDWISKAELEITSFGVSIARILKKYISDNTESKELCPNCQSKIIYINGCKECSRENNPNCTYSKCG
jgi:ribonucleoside-diphosphate reductase alpha chain